MPQPFGLVLDDVVFVESLPIGTPEKIIKHRERFADRAV